MTLARRISILGTRGIPAAHGGFETFAERLALHMRNNGWRVTVYCQRDEGPPGPDVDEWNGIRRVGFAAGAGARGTMRFDWRCVRHAMGEKGVMLALGYNTAIFSALLRLSGHSLLTNMDGIEWKRAKWPIYGRVWLYINEWIGALTSSQLIADHPEIAKHLSRRRPRRDIITIPYGADEVEYSSEHHLDEFGLKSQKYFISIGRIEPENNILTMIKAYAATNSAYDFVCLGKLEPEENKYHAEVLKAGAGKVKFLGAIYDKDRLASLRVHAAAYCHGHSVGGTNPSLVESLGAGNAVIAHDNKYNRWVVGEGHFLFSNIEQCKEAFSAVESNLRQCEISRVNARSRFLSAFQWPQILSQYESLCEAHVQAQESRSLSRAASRAEKVL